MNTKNIISCGINNIIFIISNNIIITMESVMWRLVCPCATWRLGCHSQLGLLPRPMRQVALGSAPRIGAAQAPGGTGAAIANRAFCQDSSARWRWGLPRVLKPPKRQVALGSAPRKVRAAHAPYGSRSAPRKGRPTEAPAILAWAAPVPGALSPWPAAPPKVVLTIFSLTIPFNAKCTPAKRQPLPSPAAIATLCVKGWATITLLQSTMLCIYVNSNRGTEPF